MEELFFNNSTRLNQSIKDLYQTNNFSDITLYFDNGEQIKSHKFLLSGTSKIFHNILTNTPINSLYLKGVNHKEFQVLLEFLYMNETSVGEHRIESFIKLATELQIEEFSLVDTTTTITDNCSGELENSIYNEVESNTVFMKENISNNEKIEEFIKENINEKIKEDKIDVFQQMNIQEMPMATIRKVETNITQDTLCTEEKLEIEESNNYMHFEAVKDPNKNNLKKSVKKKRTVNHPPVFTEDAYQKIYPYYAKFVNFPDFRRKFCTTCKNQFTQRETLKMHIDSHHLGTKYKCTLCDHESTQKSSLNRHIKSVHLQLKEKCNQCDGIYTYDTLKEHQKTVHEKITYQCDQCGYKTARSNTLKEHMDFFHLGIIKYTCNQCSYKTHIQGHLKVHMKNMHNNE